jgi:hypothetical protein
MNQLKQLVTFSRYRDHLRDAVASEADHLRREILAEQLHECECAVENTISGYTPNEQVWYSPFSGDDHELVYGA